MRLPAGLTAGWFVDSFGFCHVFALSCLVLNVIETVLVCFEVHRGIIQTQLTFALFYAFL